MIFHRQSLASILTIHVAVNNLVIWVKTILIETLHEFYEHVLEEHLELIEEFELSLTGNHSTPMPGKSIAQRCWLKILT